MWEEDEEDIEAAGMGRHLQVNQAQLENKIAC